MRKIIEGLKDAIRFAKGDHTGARVTHYETASGAVKIEDSCGCIWCDVGNKPIRHNPPGDNYHVTARGRFPCTRKH